MTTTARQVNGAFVFYEEGKLWRLYDAIGPGVVKYVQEFASWPVDDTTGDPLEWKLSIVEAGLGDTTAVITDLAGGGLLITTAANDKDGINMQLGQTAGESVKLDKPLYCGIRLKLSDADGMDVFYGVGVTDNDWSGVTDALYFRANMGDGVARLVSEKDSSEWTRQVHALADDTFVTLEYWFDGVQVTAYADGIRVAGFQIAGNLTTFPDNEELRLTLEVKNNGAGSRTCTVDWLRMVHLRGA